MSRRERLTRILAVAFAVAGGAIVTVGVATGLPSTDSAGPLTRFALGFVIVSIGVSGLRGAGGAPGWDDFDGASRASRRARRLALLALLPALAIALDARGVRPWQRLHELRANTPELRADAPTTTRRAGARPSTRRPTLADRCGAVLRAEYRRPGNALRSAFPPAAFALVAPNVCALGLEHGLVQKDGAIGDGAERELVGAAIGRMAPRVQTRVLNELAVTRYAVAKPGNAGRWARCVALAYSGYDALRGGAALPPRAVFFGAVRHACAIGVARGIVPPSGVPAADSRKGVALQRILSAAFSKVSR